jgi:acyl-CoA synthetase (AMP-forming)/AMP-acid ligase II
MAEVTIYGLFEKTAVKHVDNIAFNYFNQTWKKYTYHELLVNTKGIASYLLRTGVKKGARIALIAENRPEWCEAYLAIVLCGCIAVPIDAQLGPREIRNLIVDSESKAIFLSKQTEAHIQQALDTTDDHPLPDIVLIRIDSPDFQNICETENVSHYPQVLPEDIASLIYTSGTTGIPKGVLLTHRNFCSDADAVITAKIVTPSDLCLSRHNDYIYSKSEGTRACSDNTRERDNYSHWSSATARTHKKRHFQQDKTTPALSIENPVECDKGLQISQAKNRDQLGEGRVSISPQIAWETVTVLCQWRCKIES